MADDPHTTLRERLASIGLEVDGGSDRLPRATVAPEHALAALGRMRDDPTLAMHRLVDLTAIDLEGSPRFEVVYVLQAPTTNESVRIHVPLPAQDPRLDSVVALWPAAAWLEREAFDLFGIRFRGHPDLRRLLLPGDFEGAPLRKDHALRPPSGGVDRRDESTQ